MANYFKCWYMKANIFRSNNEIHSSKPTQKYEAFTSQFPHISNMDAYKFASYKKRFFDQTSIKKMSMLRRQEIIAKYNLNIWNNLSDDMRASHSVLECAPCKAASNDNQKKLTPLQPHEHSIQINIPVPEKSLKGVEKVAAQCILDEVSGQFENIYHQNFTDVLCKLKESNVERRNHRMRRKKMPESSSLR